MKHTGDETIMSTKGQVVIPRDIRQAAGFAPGVRLKVMLASDGGITLKPALKHKISELAGCLYRPGRKPMSVKEMDKAIGDWVMADDARILRQGKMKPGSKRKRRT